MNISLSRSRLIVFGLTVMVLTVAAQPYGQVGRPQGISSPALDSLTGHDTYDYYCAACHGTSGHGDGVVARSLRTPVPDLTSIAQRSGGVFARDRVRAAVLNTEGPVTAHGTGELPVWGQILRTMDRSDTNVTVRVSNVVAYLEALQEPTHRLAISAVTRSAVHP